MLDHIQKSEVDDNFRENQPDDIIFLSQIQRM